MTECGRCGGQAVKVGDDDAVCLDKCGYTPFERFSQKVGASVEEAMPVGVGYMLCIASPDDHGGLTVTSNIDRCCLVAVLRLLAQKLETGDL